MLAGLQSEARVAWGGGRGGGGGGVDGRGGAHDLDKLLELAPQFGCRVLFLQLRDRRVQLCQKALDLVALPLEGAVVLVPGHVLLEDNAAHFQVRQLLRVRLGLARHLHLGQLRQRLLIEMCHQMVELVAGLALLRAQVLPLRALEERFAIAAPLRQRRRLIFLLLLLHRFFFALWVFLFQMARYSRFSTVFLTSRTVAGSSTGGSGHGSLSPSAICRRHIKQRTPTSVSACPFTKRGSTGVPAAAPSR